MLKLNNIKAKRTGSIVILYLKSRKKSELLFFLKTNGKKRKCSIMNYRSFAITNHQCQRHRWQIAAGPNDTGGKFATGINDTGGKFLPPVSLVLLTPCHRCQWYRRQICRRCQWRRWQIATGINHTGGKFRKNSKPPWWYNQRLGGNWFKKKTRSKKSCDTVPLNYYRYTFFF